MVNSTCSSFERQVKTQFNLRSTPSDLQKEWKGVKFVSIRSVEEKEKFYSVELNFGRKRTCVLVSAWLKLRGSLWKEIHRGAQ